MSKLAPLVILALLAGPSVVLAAPGAAGQAAGGFSSTPVTFSECTEETASPDPIIPYPGEYLPYPGDEARKEVKDLTDFTTAQAEILKGLSPEDLRQLADSLERSQATPLLEPVEVPTPVDDEPDTTHRPHHPEPSRRPYEVLPPLPDKVSSGEPIPLPLDQPQFCRFRLLGAILSPKKWKVKNVDWKTWYIYDRATGDIIDRGSEQDPDRSLGPGSIVESNLRGAPIRLGPIKKNWRGHGITSKNFSWDGKERNARFECDTFFLNNSPHYNGYYLDCWYDFDCN